MALRALEDDDKGLIDGLVVTEPSIQPEDGRFVIRFGDDPPFDPAGRTIYDSMSLMSVYAACAALAPSLPLAAAPLFRRSTSIRSAGRPIPHGPLRLAQAERPCHRRYDERARGVRARQDPRARLRRGAVLGPALARGAEPVALA